MSDDYLWDKTGEADPEVERLERTLARLGQRDRPLALPETTGARLAERGRRFLGLPAPVLAAAAGILVVAGGVWLWRLEHRGPSWEVVRLEGTPRVGSSALAATGRIAVGDWLVTDASARARVTVGEIGQVEVEPNTRLCRVGAGKDQHRLRLTRGTLHAFILAPPRRFVVETPSAAAVDLGCSYTLAVDDAGGGLVTVLSGWVSFERAGRESFIPAGARCATRPGFGPGTPYFADASDAFKNALAALDVGTEETRRAAALRTLLAEARPEDALTLWHLLVRLKGAARDAAYERLAVLVPPPAGVTREGVMRGDHAMIDAWWNALGFGDTSWWRLWQGAWPQP